MIFSKQLLSMAAAACFVCLLCSSTVSAHDVLKDPLKERYGLRSVSCSACHPGSNKAINNAFGLKFKTAFKGKDFTKRVKEAKAEKNKALEEEIDKEMVVEFNKAIEEIEKESMTMKDILTAGLLNGTKLEKGVIAKMGEAQGVKDEKK